VLLWLGGLFCFVRVGGLHFSDDDSAAVLGKKNILPVCTCRTIPPAIPMEFRCASRNSTVGLYTLESTPDAEDMGAGLLQMFADRIFHGPIPSFFRSAPLPYILISP